jgi:hypothetical protein
MPTINTIAEFIRQHGFLAHILADNQSILTVDCYIDRNGDYHQKAIILKADFRDVQKWLGY